MPQHPPVNEEAVKGSPVKVLTYQPEPTPIDPGGGINPPPPAGTTRESDCVDTTHVIVKGPDPSPCIQKNKVRERAQNPVISSRNADLLTKAGESPYEFGTEQNLISWPGSNYMDRPIRSNEQTNTYTSQFTWDATNGYTVGFSHDHPLGSAPSPGDVYTMVKSLENANLQAAGTAAIAYYKSNVSMTTVTTDGTLVLPNQVAGPDRGKYRSKTSAVFLLKNDSLRLSFFMKTVEDRTAAGYQPMLGQVHYRQVLQGFTGSVYYFGLNRQYMNGYRWKQGRITKTVSLQTVAPAAQPQRQVNASGLKPSLNYIADCHWVVYDVYRAWYNQNTGELIDEIYQYSYYEIECDLTPETGGGGGGGGTGGGGTPSPCANPSQEIKMDSLLKHFPCATKLILNNLINIADYHSLVQPFNTTRKPDLVWQDGALTWNAPIANSTAKEYKLGETSTYIDSRTATITLNTSMLQNSSQLFVAAAAIHETFHAYINYNIRVVRLKKKG